MTAGAPIVTALRASGRGRVAVDLDGTAWRVLPCEPVLRSGLSVGVALDRERARTLRRALRAHDAERAAFRALRYRDHTAASLERRLARRGHAEAERSVAVERLQRAGLVDDRRFAAERAAALARREAGDAMIHADLAAHGVSGEVAEEAVGGLEPEARRAARIAARRGAGPPTLRRLAARGFAEESIEPLVADLGDGAVP